jgi:hypothetical protein
MPKQLAKWKQQKLIEYSNMSLSQLFGEFYMKNPYNYNDMGVWEYTCLKEFIKERIKVLESKK